MFIIHYTAGKFVGPFANVTLAEQVLLGDPYYGNAVTQDPRYRYDERKRRLYLVEGNELVAAIVPLVLPEGDAEDQTGLNIEEVAETS